MNEPTTIEPEPRVRRRWLPAAPTGWTLVAFVVAIAFLAGTIGWTIGRGRTPARSSADVAFLDDMIRHHESAVALSQLEAANGTEEQIKTFAKEILKYQSYEIGLMEQGLREDGLSVFDRPATAMGWMGMEPIAPAEMPGLATEAQMAQLREATGEDATVLFVELMTRHHVAGIHMAEYAAEHASSKGLRALAASMARNQAIEVNEMRTVVEQQGLPADLPGPVSVPPPAGSSRGEGRLPDAGADAGGGASSTTTEMPGMDMSDMSH